MNTTEFLKQKGLLTGDCTEFTITWANGLEIKLNDLLEEFARGHAAGIIQDVSRAYASLSLNSVTDNNINKNSGIHIDHAKAHLTQIMEKKPEYCADVVALEAQIMAEIREKTEKGMEAEIRTFLCGSGEDTPKGPQGIFYPDSLQALLDRIQVEFGSGCRAILEERHRQIHVEKYKPQDDIRVHGDTNNLGRAAAVYAIYGTLGSMSVKIGNLWPWDWQYFKNKTRSRNLARAGALVAAQYDAEQLDIEVTDSIQEQGERLQTSTAKLCPACDGDGKVILWQDGLKEETVCGRCNGKGVLS